VIQRTRRSCRLRAGSRCSRRMARHRCTECRKRFTAAVTASGHQRVCGERCRQRRRNRHARKRRRSDLEGHRVDELARQRKRRDAVKEGVCHGPASDANQLELHRKLQQMVDRVAALSRATFRRETLQILRKCGPFFPGNVDGTGPRHELPSALGAAEKGSRSVARGDRVTDPSGSG